VDGRRENFPVTMVVVGGMQVSARVWGAIDEIRFELNERKLTGRFRRRSCGLADDGS
jgi:hypothetical protein